MKSRLKIDVEGLHKGPIDFEFSVSPNLFELGDDPEFSFPEDIRGSFTAKFVGGETVSLKGRLQTKAVAGCVRCLYGLEFPIDVEVMTAFMPMPERIDEDMDPLEVEKTYYEHGIIYPMERLREEILLQLPFLPSCELQDAHYCPVRGVEVGSMVFGSQELEKSVAAPSMASDSEGQKNRNSWKDQLARVREKLDSDGNSK